MNAIRNHSSFKFIAILLGLCFAIFAFHFVLHLGHDDADVQSCPVCQAIAAFAILLAMTFVLNLPADKRIAFRQETFLLYQSRYFTTLGSRAPPAFS